MLNKVCIPLITYPFTIWGPLLYICRKCALSWYCLNYTQMSYRMSFILPITKLILTSSMKITPYTVKYKINLFSKVFFLLLYLNLEIFLYQGIILPRSTSYWLVKSARNRSLRILLFIILPKKFFWMLATDLRYMVVINKGSLLIFEKEVNIKHYISGINNQRLSDCIITSVYSNVKTFNSLQRSKRVSLMKENNICCFSLTSINAKKNTK